ncbi:MAG: dephospho-CoA kinase [Clostridia bacterium]|nr:dephospho-CoA kinase [Clostridia bacterium]
MLVIGLTGGIASGKSTVSKYLKSLGAAIIDADLLARQAVEPGEKGWQKIKEYFGEGVFLPQGHLDRRKLAEIIFNDEEKRKVLNSIIHPEVVQKTKELIERYKREGQVPLIVVDAPLLIEAGMHNLVDEVWVLNVKPEVQVQRVMERDNISRDSAVRRLKSQLSTEEKLKYAHRVIDNNETVDKTIRQVQDFWQDIVDKEKTNGGKNNY